MNPALLPSELRPIYEKVAAGQRVSESDALELYATKDINALGRIANLVRERKNGNVATYILNRYVNYANVCILSCQFCAFGAKKREAHAFEHSIAEIAATVKSSLEQGITEVHMVGGLHPTLQSDWYLELLRTMRALDPNLHLKCFTAVEIRHLAERVFKRSIGETLAALARRVSWESSDQGNYERSLMLRAGGCSRTGSEMGERNEHRCRIVYRVES